MTLVSQCPEEVTGLTGFPESDRELKTITDRLWGALDGKGITENKVDKGRVIWGQNINDILAGLNVNPDFKFRSNQEKTALDYIHRTTNTEEIYLVANRFARKGINDFEFRYLTNLPDRYEQVEGIFRVSGKTPQLWDPKTGETKETPFIDLYKQGGKKYFSVYEPGTYILTWSDGSKEIVNHEKPPAEKNLSDRWKVHFDPKWGGPEKVEIDELKSWIKFNDPDIKYYSGTARYMKSFSLTQKDINAKLVILDLGNVQEMASVKINGHQTQVVWSAPFIFNITPFIKAGTNMLEVEVVNLWPNRLIGDSKLPENQRLTKTNVNKFKGKDAENYLRESGLLGPVKISMINKQNLK